jgi:hypothetical protein
VRAPAGKKAAETDAELRSVHRMTVWMALSLTVMRSNITAARTPRSHRPRGHVDWLDKAEHSAVVRYVGRVGDRKVRRAASRSCGPALRHAAAC